MFVTEQRTNNEFCVLLQKLPANISTTLQHAYGKRAMEEFLGMGLE
jgi:hypothetical protein